MCIRDRYKGLDSVDKKSFIRDSTEETIKLASNNDPYETKQNWYKLETLCAEFKKLGEEDLAISLTNQATLLTIQANGLGIFRPSHYFESFPYKKLDTPEGKLFNILNKLNNVLSTKTYHRILARIRSTTSVSYTHLDVYKRQGLYSRVFAPKIGFMFYVWILFLL